MISEDAKKLLEASKINAQLVIKPIEKLIPIYKFCILLLIIYNIIISSLFGFYIYKSSYNSRLSTRAFVTSINKTVESCANVKRSDVRMD